MINIHLDTVDSTNTYAKNHLSDFPPNQMVCITAEEQTAGRGRRLHQWISPRGVNLYITFFFRLPQTTADLTCLSHLLAYSLASVLFKENLPVQIKWPNDLLLNRKKFGGILCETILSSQEIEVILGIGINVNMSSELLDSIDQPATSLSVETGHIWDKNGLLKKLQNQFIEDLAIFTEEGFSPFHAKINPFLAFKGEKVCVQDGNKKTVGIYEGLFSDGSLILTLPNGERHLCYSGILSCKAATK